MSCFRNLLGNHLLLFIFLILLPSFALNASNRANKFIVKGVFIDKDTGKRVQGVSVLILNTKDQSKISLVTGKNGDFKVTLNDLAEYKIQGSKPMHLFSLEKSVLTYDLTPNTNIDLEFKIERIHFNTPYLLPNFKFHLNDKEIANTDARYITLLKEILDDHPDMSIEIRNHTDSRGSDDYNLTLSQKRADEIKKLLIKKGLPAQNILALGIGEKELLNECENNIKCSSTAHLINRRSEFVLTTP
ncbi:OmpA family protein [Sediminitomix flava]|uniref:OmpA family protein n=1 Tax=Sediminitomix flava TaxID=379075 RepID=A0A315ZFZ9_SEDFL|nr:OmpA family protein [Sediminitomix flava]PWJ44079.1 OmpA family protein [Sediminitomix flava]